MDLTNTLTFFKDSGLLKLVALIFVIGVIALVYRMQFYLFDTRTQVEKYKDESTTLAYLSRKKSLYKKENKGKWLYTLEIFISDVVVGLLIGLFIYFFIVPLIKPLNTRFEISLICFVGTPIFTFIVGSISGRHQSFEDWKKN